MKVWLAALCALAVSCSLASCRSERQTVVKIGVNAPITGDIPKVGEGTKYAAELWLEDVNKAGGIEVGGKKYPVALVVEDSEAKAESAVKANTKLITQDEVLAIIGPQASKEAIPAGAVANDKQTPMISPWSTNPDTTAGRPYVFRACFLDPFQGHHRRTALRLPRLLPRPFSRAGAGKFHQRGIQVHQGGSAL